MFRALMTLLASSFVVILLGIPVAILAFVHPVARAGSFLAYAMSVTTLWGSGARLTVEGTEHVDAKTPKFFMGNHQSALDIPVLIVALGGAVRFLAKDSLFRIPLFGFLLARYGYIPIHRSRPRATLDAFQRMLERMRDEPVSLAAYPEGTRSRDGRLLPFRRGTMKIGQRVGLPIVPFVIDGSINVAHRDRFRAVPGPIRLTFLEPIPAEDVTSLEPDELHDRVRNAILEGLGQQASGSARAEDAPVTAAKET